MKLYDKNTEQSIEFDIPKRYKKIAVNCSGGADSSILLYLTIQYLIDNNRNDTQVSVLTCSNDKKHRWNGRKAADAINYVLDKTQYQNFNLHYTYYRDVQDYKYFKEIEYDLFENKKIDLIVSGITANPQSSAIVADINGNEVDLCATGLDVRNGADKEVWSVHRDCSWYNPFENVDKKFIGFLYKHFDAEDLLPLTRSCEAVPEPGTPFDSSFEKTPCGTCWWCLERKWAFGYF